MSPEPTRRNVVLGLGALTLGLSACTRQPIGPAPESTGQTPTQAPLRFQVPAASGSWDPVAAEDIESQRIVRQVYDTLIGVDPETGTPSPNLATEWTQSEDRLRYVFTLREGVSFHDGTPFDAAAVVMNVERWLALSQSSDPQLAAIASLFDANKDEQAAIESPRSVKARQEQDAPSQGQPSPDSAPLAKLGTPDPFSSADATPLSPVRSCRALDAHRVELLLARPITPLITALTQPAFAIVSPRAIVAAKAQRSATPKGPLSTRPVGTGSYSATRGDDDIILTAVAQPWRGAPQVKEARFQAVSSSSRREWDLVHELSDGFDLVGVDSLKALISSAQQVTQRDPFSVTYLGVNRSGGPLGDERVRRAVAHAIDRGPLQDGLYLQGTTASRSLLPASLLVPEPPTTYPHDKDKARRLLAAAKYDGAPVSLLYPTGVGRPYLPQPERLVARLVKQLLEIGLAVEPTPLGWDDGYLATVRSGKHAGLHLLGIQGSYRDPENFLGPLFTRKNPQLGYDSAEVRRRMRVAKAMAEGKERIAAYADIVELLSVDLAVIPLLYPISAVALGSRIASCPTSPVLNEPLHSVSLAQ